MVKAALVEADIADGKRLLAALDDSDLQIVAAFWYLWPEGRVWNLILASSLFERGPISSYSRVEALMGALKPPLSFDLEDVSLVSPQKPLIRILESALHTGPGISQIRFTQNTIGNHFVEDALIYRLARPAKKH